jgi:cytochrome c oxidase assembly factor CtaG
MVQHVVLSQLVPLALLICQRRFAMRLPAAFAWTLGVGVMIATSIPAAYVIAGVPSIGWSMRGLVFAAGIAFWSPVVGSAIRPPLALLYLITACFATTLAGAYIAFSAITSDQQVAGLIMWIPCCLVFLTAALVVVSRMLTPDSHAASAGVDPAAP